MGCDIHAYLELKIKGVWFYYNEFDIMRDYILFAKIGDVRNDGSIKPLRFNIGLPDDMSVITSLERKRWGIDGHSEGWLDKDEILHLILWYNFKFGEYQADRLLGYLMGYSYEEYFKELEMLPKELKEIEDIRIIFWFDN